MTRILLASAAALLLAVAALPGSVAAAERDSGANETKNMTTVVDQDMSAQRRRYRRYGYRTYPRYYRPYYAYQPAPYYYRPYRPYYRAYRPSPFFPFF